MNARIFNSITFSIIVALLIIISTIIFAPLIYGQEDTIVYPVEELNNCQNREDCMNYCDDLDHIAACVDFGVAHGLLTEEEREFALEYSDSLHGEGGPGGCTTPTSCDAYCEDISNLNECLAFADDHGYEDQNIEDGRKIVAYLERGGQMPGGCRSERECEAYCSDFGHFEECIAFADGAGLDIGDHGEGPSGDVSKEQLRHIMQLMQDGETPGGCRSERECEAYCSDGHFEECIAFGEKVGFMSHEEAEMARRTGGMGPGGCSSREECDAFCNNPDNREQCFSFAEDHGLIDEGEFHEIEQGLDRVRGFLDQASPEALECLEHNLGTDVIEGIRSGNIAPSRDFAQKAESCFRDTFREHAQDEYNEGEYDGRYRDYLDEGQYDGQYDNENYNQNPDDWYSQNCQGENANNQDCQNFRDYDRPHDEGEEEYYPNKPFNPNEPNYEDQPYNPVEVDYDPNYPNYPNYEGQPYNPVEGDYDPNYQNQNYNYSGSYDPNYQESGQEYNGTYDPNYPNYEGTDPNYPNYQDPNVPYDPNYQESGEEYNGTYDPNYQDYNSSYDPNYQESGEEYNGSYDSNYSTEGSYDNQSYEESNTNYQEPVYEEPVYEEPAYEPPPEPSYDEQPFDESQTYNGAVYFIANILYAISNLIIGLGN